LKKTVSMPVIFADVDETIIRCKSLFEFLALSAALEPAIPPERRALLSQSLSALLASGCPRAEVNRAFYEQVLTGVSVRSAEAIARTWFSTALAERPGFLDQSVVSLLRVAQANGSELVLVTGSFSELVAPLAAFLDTRHVLAAPLEIVDDRYTGRLLGPPTIGEGKAEAIRRYAAARGDVALARCGAIGDDLSDLAFLKLVGKVFVPATSDARLVIEAKRHDWIVLS